MPNTARASLFATAIPIPLVPPVISAVERLGIHAFFPPLFME